MVYVLQQNFAFGNNWFLLPKEACSGWPASRLGCFYGKKKVRAVKTACGKGCSDPEDCSLKKQLGYKQHVGVYEKRQQLEMLLVFFLFSLNRLLEKADF